MSFVMETPTPSRTPAQPVHGAQPKAAGSSSEASNASTLVIARVRRLMLVTLALTFGAAAAVLALVGYRLATGAGAAAPINAEVSLRRGAKIVHTAVAEGRIVVTLDIAGATEIRLYDLRTLKPAGTLSFTPAP